MYNPFSLKGKIILVTGSSAGIGKATAIECSKMGAQLIITGRNEDRLNETFQLLSGKGHLKFAGDLCDLNFIKQLTDNLPAIDGIVHSAGIVFSLPFKFFTKEKMDSMFEINVEAPILLTNFLTREGKIKKNASIVFLSSISGVMISQVSNSLYSATKGAINGIAKGMALEFANRGVRVNTIVPGMIETDLIEGGAITREQMEEDAKNYPLNRYGKPEDVAHAAIYLLSDASVWVTGSNLLVDGGITLR